MLILYWTICRDETQEQQLEAGLEQQEANLEQGAVLEPEHTGKESEAKPSPV